MVEAGAVRVEDISLGRVESIHVRDFRQRRNVQ